MCGTMYPRSIRKSAAARLNVSKGLFAEAVSLTVSTAVDTMGSGSGSETFSGYFAALRRIP